MTLSYARRAPLVQPRRQRVCEARALGALLGALAGDAGGAVLEFIGHKPSLPEVERAMRYPGGGVLKLAPGQITDDGELTMALLHALAESKEWQLDRVAAWYGRWFNSQPFDIGNATSGGLEPARDLPFGVSQGLGVRGWSLDDDRLVAIARDDSSLTHPNPACGDAVAAYTLAVAHLVAVPGDRVGAWDRARAWAARRACEEVRGWLDAAERDQVTDYERMIGFVKHGFTEAFRQLRRGASWETAVRETLLGGGDTDTNACIVGGMIGAAGGAEGIPILARGMVLDCDTRAGRERAEWLHPHRVGSLVRGMID